MSYSKACEVLGLTTPKSMAENARLAKVIRAALTINAPLRKADACEVGSGMSNPASLPRR